MGINKVQLGIAVDSLMQEILEATPSSHNIIPGRDEADAHPLSAITGLKDVTDKIENMSISQKTINEGFDYFYGHPDTVVPVAGQYVPVTMKLGNMEFVNNFIILKSKRTYEISIILGYANPGVKVWANIHYSVVANNVSIGYFSPYNETTAADYEYPSCINIVYTNEEDHDIQLGLRCDTTYNTDKISSAVSSFIVKEIAKQYIIDPLEYVNTYQGIEDTPVGNVISLMGKTAPSHYLICDGSIHNITEYPHLSQYFKDEFGSFNFFGGDGETTFAVPDLRNEFLRGYHGDKTILSSGEIGVHQDATKIPRMGLHSGTLYVYRDNSKVNVDWGDVTTGTMGSDADQTFQATSANIRYGSSGNLGTTTTAQPYAYSTRPTNTAVLFCIKYEPTYFMRVNGLVEETVLWEGDIGTDGVTGVTNNIDLSDSIENYDGISIYFTAVAGGNKYLQIQNISPDDIKRVIASTGDHQISMIWGYGSSNNYSSITSASTLIRLSLAQSQSHVTKVIGTKYKAKQGSGSDDTYTDQEIIDMMEGVINGHK